MVRAAMRGWTLAAVVLASACSGDDDGASGNGADPFANAPIGKDGKSGSGALAGNSALDSDDHSPCPEGIVRTDRVVPRVVLVLDGSCSMSTPYPANGAQSSTMCEDRDNSRWAALRNALLDPQVGVVARLQNVVQFGVAIFGTQPMCPITHDPVQPVIDNYDAVSQAFGQGAPPGMYTPTGPALDWVYDNLILPTAPDSKMGPQIVVLATDGEPNSCDNADTNYQPSIDALNKSTALNVATYVISLADAQGEFHDHLQQLADIGVGGSGKLYEPGSPEELQADLELLIGGAVGCDVTLNGQVRPGMEASATVSLNGMTLRLGSDWELADSRHIRLKGSACDQLKASPESVLSADFPCGSVDVD